MEVTNLNTCPRNERGGQVSYLLLGGGEGGSHNLAITWVEGEPGSEQPDHRHDDKEQVYVIVSGTGLMRVAQEERQVERGDLVVIPPGSGHSIRNVGSTPLVFVSATSPPFELPPPDSPFFYSHPEG